MATSVFLDQIGERQIIRKFIAPLLSLPLSDYLLDDCAVVPQKTGNTLLITVDQGPSLPFLEILGIGTPADVGHYHVTINISDIAAMGGTPIGLVMALSLPRNTTTSFLEGYLSGIQEACNEYEVPLLGGDTKESSSLRNAITVLGCCEMVRPLSRKGAAPGDKIFVSHKPGRTLSNYTDGARQRMSNNNTGAIERPTAKLSLGKALLHDGKCHCCMDMSDGLLAAADDLAKTNNVVFELNISEIPIALPKNGVADIQRWRNFVLNVGGDCDLMFTMASDQSGLTEEVGAIEIGNVRESQEGNPGISQASLQAASVRFEPWEGFSTEKKISNEIKEFI